MRSIGRAWRVGVAALMLVGLMPGATGAQSVDCADPDLDRIEAEMAVARAAVTAENAVALRAAIDSARAQLDAIAVACWDADASPGPSLPPIDLSGSGTIGGRSIAFPADLVVVEDGLMRPIDQGDLRSDALTVADSAASAELLGSQPDEPVPAGFRVLSLAVGDLAVALASVGVTDPDDTIPTDAIGALGAMVTAAEDDTGGTVRIDFGDVSSVTFPDGLEGAAVDVAFVDASEVVLVDGAFLLRPLPDGDWALGVALGAPGGMDRLRPELAATIASIGEPA